MIVDSHFFFKRLTINFHFNSWEWSLNIFAMSGQKDPSGKERPDGPDWHFKKKIQWNVKNISIWYGRRLFWCWWQRSLWLVQMKNEKTGGSILLLILASWAEAFHLLQMWSINMLPNFLGEKMLHTTLIVLAGLPFFSGTKPLILPNSGRDIFSNTVP